MIAELNSIPNQTDQRINMSVPLHKAGTKPVIKGPNFLVIRSKSGMPNCMTAWQIAAGFYVP